MIALILTEFPLDLEDRHLSLLISTSYRVQ
jgi:hypothetical protein